MAVRSLVVLLALLAPLKPASREGAGFAGGFESIQEKELEADVRALASPDLEGRYSPSAGLETAARLIEKRFAEAGLAFAPDSAIVFREIAGGEKPDGEGAGTSSDGTFRRPFQRDLQEPHAAGCALALEIGADPKVDFQYGRDFVPVKDCTGEASGELVFAGFGIDSSIEKYSDIDGLKLRGKIAIVVQGEPRHAKRFDGPEVTLFASVWEKVETLAEAGAAGVLLVRRAPEPRRGEIDTARSASDLAYRYGWAEFNNLGRDPAPKKAIPALEISAACAASLLGQDVEALASRIDKTVRPVRVKGDGRRASMKAATRAASVRVDNVVGLVRGVDPALVDEYVVVAAHYDHIGIDPRGRIGCGADDNASGTAALLELAEALAQAGPRRSVFLCSFAGEELGLLGSKAWCARPPVPKEQIVAMINLDMIGRGDAAEVAVLGVVQNPAFEKLLGRARRLRPSGVKDVVVRQGEELFQRSDHFSFHQIGVPVMFFFEGLPIDRNKDYHTWRDTVDQVDFEKMLRTTRLVYNTAWLLSNDDERPPPPQG